MSFDLVITNGRVLGIGGSGAGDGVEGPVDVAIAGETIAAVGPGLARSARRVIDASGKIVMPGALDVHVHLELPFCGTTSSDDWDSGTRAAACGGVTTVIDFAIPREGESLAGALANWSAKARAKACVDYAFHLAITDWDRHGPEMPAMVAAGCPTFKEFMIYAAEGWQADDRAIFSTLERCRDLGAMLLVHAESSRVLDELIARHHTPELMARHGARLHAMTRPDFIEAEAVARAVTWAEATGGRLYVVHMSTAKGAEIVRAAQKRGVPVLAETCAQYLVLDESVFDGPDGHLFACCPQVKTVADQDRLWRGLVDGDVAVVSTDTCTFTRSQKARWEGDWTQIPMGLPGVETLVPLLVTKGVRAGRITWERLVEVCCANPARSMGLYPRKGVIAPGSDADIAIIDPERTVAVDHATLQTNADWSPYQGWELAGFAEATFSRGRQVVEDYRFVGENGWGRWLARPPFATGEDPAR